ncbi:MULTISPECIES: VOC family protein [Halorussus]|uniref:VOC family protein n=1 Tax=Halorussus TaxID=1070314 RepID=UPI0020A06679|nr:VOC family protein [Halorussus vallis]USZ76696.1 VOC family protein [Halorussus vallis]
MPVEIGRTTVLVDDYDAAIAFYTEVLGLEVLADTELENGFRAVHVGDPAQAPVGLWLMEPPSDRERDRIGDQTGDAPALVFYTDDIREEYETLRARGVEFRDEPESGETGTSAHFEDYAGNHCLLVELHDADD